MGAAAEIGFDVSSMVPTGSMSIVGTMCIPNGHPAKIVTEIAGVDCFEFLKAEYKPLIGDIDITINGPIAPPGAMITSKIGFKAHECIGPIKDYCAVQGGDCLSNFENLAENPPVMSLGLAINTHILGMFNIVMLSWKGSAMEVKVFEFDSSQVGDMMVAAVGEGVKAVSEALNLEEGAQAFADAVDFASDAAAQAWDSATDAAMDTAEDAHDFFSGSRRRAPPPDPFTVWSMQQWHAWKNRLITMPFTEDDGGMIYMGCYTYPVVNGGMPRDLPIKVPGDFYVSKCRDACANYRVSEAETAETRSYPFFSLIWNECFCGDRYDTRGDQAMTTDSNCFHHCLDFNNHHEHDMFDGCGDISPNTMALYAQKPVGLTYIGCYKDDHPQGANYKLGVKGVQKGYGRNLFTCRFECQDYRYFAMTDGSHCTCADEYNPQSFLYANDGSTSAAPDSECNVNGDVCGDGDWWGTPVPPLSPVGKAVRVRCGGHWRNAVYATGNKPPKINKFQIG
jgi:hypothetical protein